MCIVPKSETNQASQIVCAQGGCPECMEALLLEHKRLIYVVLRRQYAGESDYADLIQEAWIGLWQAILRFDPGRGSMFSTYAGRAMRNQIWLEVERGWKKAGWIEIGGARDDLARIVTVWQAAQVHEALTEGLACLPKRLRRVIVQMYGLDGQAPMQQQEIGKQMGVSGERVRQLMQDGLGLLRLPALSMRLRSLCEQDSRQAYRKAGRMNNTWWQR
jgi:RNA polymerase sigma factor (sigma-70 family)